MASRLDGEKIERMFLHRALALCQDTDYDVRRSMCEQLQIFAKSLGPKVTKQYLLPEYTELLQDEQIAVREAAIESIVGLFDFFDEETRTQYIIPSWKKLCDDRNSKTQVLVAKHFGVFAWSSKCNFCVI